MSKLSDGFWWVVQEAVFRVVLVATKLDPRRKRKRRKGKLP